MNPPARSEAPAWLPFLLIPLGVVLLRLAYHAHRSVFALQLSELGVTPVQMGIALAFGEAMSLAGFALGAALVSVRPHAAVLIGGLLYALGIGLFTLNPEAWTTAEMLLRLGMGCFRLGAVVVLIAGSTGFQQRMLAVGGVMGADTLGVFLGPMLGGTVYVTAQQGVALLPAVLAVVVVAVSGYLNGAPRGNKNERDQVTSFGLGWRWLLSLGLCLVAVIYKVLITASSTLPYASDPSLWFNVSTLFGPAFVGALGVVLVGALLRDGSWNRSRSFGVGLILCSGAGLVFAHAALHSLDSNMRAGEALAGFAQPIIEALLLAALFGVWPKRRAGLVYLAFMLVVGFAQARAWVAFTAQPDAAASLIRWSTALGALGLALGLAAIAFSRRLEALLTASDMDAQAPAATAPS